MCVITYLEPRPLGPPLLHSSLGGGQGGLQLLHAGGHGGVGLLQPSSMTRHHRHAGGQARQMVSQGDRPYIAGGGDHAGPWPEGWRHSCRMPRCRSAVAAPMMLTRIRHGSMAGPFVTMVASCCCLMVVSLAASSASSSLMRPVWLASCHHSQQGPEMNRRTGRQAQASQAGMHRYQEEFV